MSKRSPKQINSDKKMQKYAQDIVTKHGRRIMVFSIRGSQVNVSGEKETVNILETFPDITVKELIDKMKSLGEASGDQSFEFVDCLSSANDPVLPPMTVAFCGPSWDNATARKQLTEYFCILGYGKTNGSKSFKKEEDQPVWWPDSLSWQSFAHPGKAKTPQINRILTSMFEYYGLDINTYHLEGTESSDARPRRRRNRSRVVSNNFVQSDNEEEQEVRTNNTENNDNEEVAQDPQYQLPFPSDQYDTQPLVEHHDTHPLVDPHAAQPSNQQQHDTHHQTYSNNSYSQYGYNNYNEQYGYYNYGYDQNQHYDYYSEYNSLFGHNPPVAQPQENFHSPPSNEQSVAGAIMEAMTYQEL